jgi:hypothetical protein
MADGGVHRFVQAVVVFIIAIVAENDEFWFEALWPIRPLSFGIWRFPLEMCCACSFAKW